MADFIDACGFVTTSAGIGDWTYARNIVGFQSPVAAGAIDGMTYRYRAESLNLSQWEVGYGVWGGGVLTRATVLSNNLGTTAKINFLLPPQVSIVASALDFKGANPTIFAFEGDSLSNPSINGKWVLFLKSQSAFFNKGSSFYFAQSGETAAQMVSEFTTQGGAVDLAPGQDAYYFLYAGTNDLPLDTPAATIYGYLTAMWAVARTKGYKVCAFTIPPRSSLTSAQNDTRIALNILILSNPSLYNFIVRPDVLFTDSSNTVNFLSDGLHLTDAGNVRLAQSVIGAILGTTTVHAAPFDAMAYSGVQINGAMEISQENESASISISTGTNTYVADGIRLNIAGPSVISAQQVTDAPFGFTNSVKFTVTTAEASIAAGSFAAINIPIEGYRTARLNFGTVRAQPVSFGFWVKAHRPGEYSGFLRNGGAGRSYIFPIVVNSADTWEYKTATVGGDVAGTWVGNTNGIGLILFVCLAAGSNFWGTAGVWNGTTLFGQASSVNGIASTSDTFQITGIIILPGIELPNSDKLSRIMRPYDQEMLLCQRYFRKSFPPGVACAQNAGIAGAVTTRNQVAAGFPSHHLQFMPQMCKTPTIATYNPSAANANWRDVTAASDVTVSVDPAAALGRDGVMFTTSGSVATAGDVLAIHYKAVARL